jgi:hemoglobin
VGFEAIPPGLRATRTLLSSAARKLKYSWILRRYDAVNAVTHDLLNRMEKDPQLGRFWQHRGTDGVKRERQLIVDFLVAATGGPLYYAGRDMKLSHQGMRISESDWTIFLNHDDATLKKFNVPKAEYDEVVAFAQSTKADIVES